MPLPSGVTTATATALAPVSLSGDPGKVRIEVRPTLNLYHISSGVPIASFIEVRSADEGASVSVTLPHTDQAGFQGDNGLPVTNWAYLVDIAYENDGQVVHIPTKQIVVEDGVATLNLAALPSGTFSDPTFGSHAAVTSVNGMTGAVIVGDGITQAELDLKADIASPTFTGTVGGITKSMVGLANVNNTADIDKPISTATQTALNLKAPSANPTFTGTVSGVTKAHVGLGNADNTSDANKPISTATQTALNLKQDSATLIETIQDNLAGSFLVAGTNVTLTYNDSLNTLTIASSGGGGTLDAEGVRDTIATALIEANGIDITVNDAGDTITIGTTATATGLAVLNAADAAAARTAIGAGTSSLAIGTTSTTAKAGNYTPSIADMPTGYTHARSKISGVWQDRGTTRTDITVLWIGPTPHPSVVVAPATNGMYENDIRIVTAV